MELRDLKNAILENNIPLNYFIFVSKPNNFLVEQYVKAIVGERDLISYTIEDILGYKKSFLVDDSYKILRCEEYSLDSINIENLIVITTKVSREVESRYSDNIVNFPMLEPWQIQDYERALGEGVEEVDLNILNAVCGSNIFRIDSELNKLKYFSPSQRKYLFKDMLAEGALDDVVNYDIFNLTNALQAKDLNQVKNILDKRDFLSIDPFAFLNILYQGFKRLILVWLSSNPTPENTGLKSNQIWAIKNIPHNYSKEQLINIFTFLTSLDHKFKSGELSDVDLVKYIICKVISFS